MAKTYMQKGGSSKGKKKVVVGKRGSKAIKIKKTGSTANKGVVKTTTVKAKKSPIKIKKKKS